MVILYWHKEVNYKIKNDLILGNKVKSKTSRAGTNCYYWDAIDFENMLIHICDGWQPGLNNHPFPIITNDFNSAGVIAGTGPSGLGEELFGQEFSITNGEHYYRFGRVVSCDVETIEFEFVNGFIFESIITYENLDNIHGLSYSLVFNDLPEFGDHQVGEFARAYGKETKSYASNSTAIGKYTEAYGNGTLATGKLTKAIGNYSGSFGYNTIASGHHAIATGKLTLAKGNSSFAMGSDTKATGNYAFASGYDSEASGEVAVAMGYMTKALSPYSYAEGFQTTVEIDENSTIKSRGAHVEGAGSIARGYAAHAQGISTQAIAQGAHAGGRGSVASGKYSAANGDTTQALGIASFSIGEKTIAYGKNSFVGGKESTASIEGFAFGHNAQAGEYAQALGYNAVASKFSTAVGRNCKTLNNYQVALGVNNAISEDMLFAIGNGAEWDSISNGIANLGSRSNALSIYKNGDTHITGDLRVKGSSIRLGNTIITEAQLNNLLELLKGDSILGTWQFYDSVTLSEMVGAEMEFTVVFEENLPCNRIAVTESGVYYYDESEEYQMAYDDGSTVLGYSRINITSEDNVSKEFKEWLFNNAAKVE